jgi:hypothetical protein
MLSPALLLRTVIPAPLLNGEQTATAGATIGADGEFGVAVRLIVPLPRRHAPRPGSALVLQGSRFS